MQHTWSTSLRIRLPLHFTEAVAMRAPSSSPLSASASAKQLTEPDRRRPPAPVRPPFGRSVGRLWNGRTELVLAMVAPSFAADGRDGIGMEWWRHRPTCGPSRPPSAVSVARSRRRASGRAFSGARARVHCKVRRQRGLLTPLLRHLHQHCLLLLPRDDRGPPRARNPAKKTWGWRTN